MAELQGYRRFAAVIGPGLLMAGAAVGVSHLVQSTRAGAQYGLWLIPAVLLVNLFKYPFFEFGHRYAIAAKESLVHGYQRMGRGYLVLFAVLNTVTAIISIAGVTIVTAGLAQYTVGMDRNLVTVSAVLLAVCFSIIAIGRYPLLDNVMKGIMLLLSLTTAAAAVIGVFCVGVSTEVPAVSEFVGPAGILFVIALMGWMPAPVELSVWQSLWIGARKELTGLEVSFAEAKIDFNVGYLLTVGLAVLFVLLGAVAMYQSGEAFEATAVGFAAQLIQLYSRSLGEGVGMFVAVAALTAMFSTTLTVFDAYPRSLAVTAKLLLPRITLPTRYVHWICMAVGAAAALLIVSEYRSHLKALVDLATTISFLAAPVFAYLNYRLITSPATPAAYQPGGMLRALSVLGFVFFLVFAALFLYARIMLR